jgi:hypothetical protein
MNCLAAPAEMTTPFGTPVVPEVKMIYAVSFASK